MLAVRDAGVVADDLARLTPVMPDAPAASLRQAVGHAATGTWPTAATTLYVPPPDAEDDEDLDEDEWAKETESASLYGVRLKDLAGKVVRMAHLREFHSTDEDAVICAAMAENWEPLPAS